MIIRSDDTCLGNNLFVMSQPDGWLYSNEIPENKRIISFLSDSDLFPNRLLLNQFFGKRIRTICNHDFNKFKLYINDARTTWVENQSGLGWIRVGDASYTIDPLSGKGILKNFQMIEFLLNNIKCFMTQKINIHKRYREYNLNNFINFMQQRAMVFANEKRWTDRPFWSRRQ